MTLIGAFQNPGGAVVFADRQETITDYAKWDVGKIKLIQMTDLYRVMMAGAGDSDMIEMVWHRFMEDWSVNLYGDIRQVKEAICRAATSVTKECILPYPAGARPDVELIWALQHIVPNEPINPLNTVAARILGGGRTVVFRTRGLAILPLDPFYATGNPVLLVRYLADMFFDGHLIGTDEAEAFAAFLLWEAKEYDPTCGKHSDIWVLRDDGTIGRMTHGEERYWEEHFEHLKAGMRLLPLLSCATGQTPQIYNPQDHLGRLMATIKTLSKEQARARSKQHEPRSALEKKILRNVQRVARRFT